MVNSNLVPFKKVWNNTDGTFGSKEIYFNTAMGFEFIENCFLKKDVKAVECTKIYYPDKYLTLEGNVQSFFATCQQAGISICILNDLEKEGMTVKQFLKQLEGFNGVELA